MHSAPPPPDTPLLWERLRALFGRVIAAIGAPAFIAALTLAPGMRTGIVRQLAFVEILARKLLLAEAAALAPATAPRVVEINLTASGLYTPPQPRRARARSSSRARTIDPTNPETWNARFDLAVPPHLRAVQDRRVPRTCAPWGETATPQPAPEPAPHQQTGEAFRIACRAEALRRMLNDPAPHIQRLARSRRIGVARSPESISRYALSAPRRFVGDRHDPRLTVDIFSVAIRALSLLTDTS